MVLRFGYEKFKKMEIKTMFGGGVELVCRI